MKLVRLALFGTALGAACLVGCLQQEISFKGNTLPGIEKFSVHILAARAKESPVTGSFGWGHSFFKVPNVPGLDLSGLDDRLHCALLSAFTDKGLTFKESGSDLLVSYALAGGTEIDAEELNKAYGIRLEADASEQAPDLHYKRGVVIVDVVDRKAKQLLWRGAIMVEIDLSWPAERKQERCTAAINELLRYYPHP